MNLFRLITIFSLVAVSTGLGTRFLFAQTHAAASSLQRPAASNSDSQNLFAIIGQVARPGVYRAPHSNPYLVDLIHNAGGFVEKASGQIRIIRQTENGRMSFPASGGDFQLQPGDVVVAGRKFELTIAPKAIGATDTISAAKPAAELVHLAFVNLASRPIVLKMRPEQATVGQILKLLGQSPALAGTVQVIAATETPNPTPANLQLTTESVLVFDPAVIQLSRLPALPMTVVNESDRRNSTITTVHSETVTDSRPSGQVAVVDQVHSPAVPPAKVLEPPSLTDDFESVADAADESPVAVQTASLPPRSVVPELQVELQSRNDPLTPPNASADEANEGSWLSTLMYWLLSIATFVGTSWGAVRFKQQRGNRSSSRSPIIDSVSNSVREVVGNRLSEIIYDRLPVVEEPVAPSQQSGTKPAVEREQKVRVDAAHTPRRPHFQPNPTTPVGGQAALEPAIAPPDISDAAIRINRPHETPTARESIVSVNRASENEPEGLLDRVLSRVHGAANR